MQASPRQARPTPAALGVVRLANDATYLYVGVEGFFDPWDDSLSAHLHVYLTPDPTSIGTVAADDWMGSITFSPSSRRPTAIGHY